MPLWAELLKELYEAITSIYETWAMCFNNNCLQICLPLYCNLFESNHIYFHPRFPNSLTWSKFSINLLNELIIGNVL